MLESLITSSLFPYTTLFRSGGICTVDNNESNPESGELSIGTPITGNVVSAAVTPARCAELPAPAIMIFNPRPRADLTYSRSEEHTSELQSLRHLVCRLPLEK